VPPWTGGRPLKKKTGPLARPFDLFIRLLVRLPEPRIIIFYSSHAPETETYFQRRDGK